jgi:parallel beta-helix repeat protein
MRLALASIAVMAAPAAHAGLVIVGSCKVGTQLPTIQQAVNASAPGGTVQICPGSYTEQVAITKNLTLTGLVEGNSAQAVILPPAAGLAVNTTYLGSTYPVAAQILVQNATVTLSNLTVDGTGNGISACSPDVVGVLYQNASGTIKGNLIRNQYIAPFATYGGCQSGQGIYVEGSGAAASVSIQNNTVQAFQKNGITVTNGGVSFAIGGNTVLGLGATRGAGENGMQLSFGATGSVTTNRVGDEIWQPDQFGDTGDAASGILVYDSPSITINGNRVSSTQYGIVVVSDGQMSADGAQITGNDVGRTYLYDAIDMCGAGSAKITSNILDGSDEAGVHLDSSCGAASTGNQVTGNTINGACAAILEGSGSGGTTSPNTYQNAATVVLTGTDTCSAAQARVVRLRHPRAVRH